MAAIDAALKAGGKILSIYNDPASDFEIERKAEDVYKRQVLRNVCVTFLRNWYNI